MADIDTRYKSLATMRRKPANNLLTSFEPDSGIHEVGIDEAGRGPLLGRVYSAAVVLPKDDSFRHEWMKDSKKFTNWEKLQLTSCYIKEHAIAYSVSYEDESSIDSINILQATYKSMHKCIYEVTSKLNTRDLHLLVDGSNFKQYIVSDADDDFINIPHTCVVSGDNTYSSIAAASILAKVARDEYINELCNDNPLLDTYYGISSNKGYGSQQHRDGINAHGISKWHRKSYGICKDHLHRVW